MERVWEEKMILFESYVQGVEEQILGRQEKEVLMKIEELEMILPREVHTNSEIARLKMHEKLAIKSKE